jgi:hypothetical protein
MAARYTVSGAAPDLRVREFPAPGYKRQPVARWAFDKGSLLLAIDPTLTQIFPLGLRERALRNPPEVMMGTMCKASAHSNSYQWQNKQYKKTFLLLIYTSRKVFLFSRLSANCR